MLTDFERNGKIKSIEKNCDEYRKTGSYPIAPYDVFWLLEEVKKLEGRRLDPKPPKFSHDAEEILWLREQLSIASMFREVVPEISELKKQLSKAWEDRNFWKALANRNREALDEVYKKNEVLFHDGT